MRRFRPSELQAYLADAENPPLLLDVREPWEFALCQLDGSRLVPMRQVPQALEEWQPDDEIVVICHHGIRSAAVARFMEQHGFTNVINLEGGVDAWAREVDPSMAVY